RGVGWPLPRNRITSGSLSNATRFSVSAGVSRRNVIRSVRRKIRACSIDVIVLAGALPVPPRGQPKHRVSLTSSPHSPTVAGAVSGSDRGGCCLRRWLGGVTLPAKHGGDTGGGDLPVSRLNCWISRTVRRSPPCPQATAAARSVNRSASPAHEHVGGS